MPPIVLPPSDILATLPPRSQRLLRLTARMQHGAAGRAWHWWRTAFGARAVFALLGDPPIVHGWEHVASADRTRPLLLLANHRAYTDFFVVASVLVRRARWVTGFTFPVRGHYCYDGWPGAALNALGAGFAAFPPFFRTPTSAAIDAWGLETLVALCREGPGRVVGFHPEGTRNTGDDPWALLPAQPGAGRLLLAARPQALPVFIAGLANSWDGQRALRRAGVPVRVRIGAPIDCAPFADLPMRARSYVTVGAAVTERIAALAAEDRAAFG